MINKYPALRFLIVSNRVVAFIWVAVCILAAIIGFTAGAIGASVLCIVSAALGLLVIIASGELVQVFLDIEENTRKSLPGTSLYQTHQGSPGRDDPQAGATMQSNPIIKQSSDTEAVVSHFPKEATSSRFAPEPRQQCPSCGKFGTAYSSPFCKYCGAEFHTWHSKR